MDYLLSMPSVAGLPDPLFIFCGATEFLPDAAAEVKRLGLPEMTAHGVGDRFCARLIDPVLDRRLEKCYKAIAVGDDYEERKDRGTARLPHH